ncbi:unnamed protein product [Arabidopsis thaliana]|uniref:(thale cress) hypothetical protein n=1 Tax=Arabidopsis thaliana TaxID=3702 RepID=A0A7G2FBP3_ARATH|nr:unnamed protein product [Arabidopsis thaliana]
MFNLQLVNRRSKKPIHKTPGTELSSSRLDQIINI